MTYQQARDEAARKNACNYSAETARELDPSDLKEIQIGSFTDGSDFGKQWEEKRVRELIEALKWAVKQDESACIILTTNALKAYEEGK